MKHLAVIFPPATATRVTCATRADAALPRPDWGSKLALMAATADPSVVPERTTDEQTEAGTHRDPGFLVIVWNDPVNFMDYVTLVFMKVFGWNKAKAETHMLEVHHKGRSVVAQEGFEKAEYYVHQLQAFQLQATMEKAG